MIQSQCSIFFFFNFINLFFKIQMYQTSANFRGWFRLKGKSRKTSIIKSTKSVFFKFRFWGFGGLQPGSPLGCALPLFNDTYYEYIVKYFGDKWLRILKLWQSASQAYRRGKTSLSITKINQFCCLEKNLYLLRELCETYQIILWAGRSDSKC
jgi:hypothetical protein